MKTVLVYQLKSDFHDAWYRPQTYVVEDEADLARCKKIAEDENYSRILDILEVEDDVTEIDISKYLDPNYKYVFEWRV